MAALPYIQLYVSDYLADTAHLTAAQHGAYLLLIFNYWQRGGQLSNVNGRLANVARMTPEEWAANADALAEFFEVSGDTWTHPRIERDLAAVTAKSTKKAEAGRASARVRAASAQQPLNSRSTSAPQAMNYTDTDTDTDTEADQEQASALVKPKPKPVAAASRLPDDWTPDDADLAFCRTERPDLSPQSTADRFRDYWTAQPGVKGRRTDWHATWRNWVRSERALPAPARPVVGGLGVAGQSTAAAAQRWLEEAR